MSISPERLALLKSAMGIEPFDTILENLKIVNVYTKQVELGHLGFRDGRIAHLPNKGSCAAMARLDCTGYFAIPGFIDTHVHIDSTLLTPENLAELIVPHGTTSVFADPMEISNVAGITGLKAFFENSHLLPYHLFLEIPSRVPSAPGLETTGGSLGLKEVKKLLNWQSTISLGELDPSKVLGLRSEYLKKVDAALREGKITNGHTVGLNEEELSVYTCAGILDDHECIDFDQALLRIQNGLTILIREGSTERNLEALISGLVERHCDTRFWAMCTDDKHPNEIHAEGHIDYMVNKAIQLGIHPIEAIQMATLNAAIHFRLDHTLGSLAPGRWADIILTPSLDHIIPEKVFFKGILVAENGRLISKTEQVNPYPDSLFHTIRIQRGKSPFDYHLKCAANSVEVNVIQIHPDQIVNSWQHETLQVSNENVIPDPSRDILKIAVVERYGKNGNIGISFIRGFGLRQGAISSSVSHDHHNLVVVGADEVSMSTCVEKTEEMQGGFVVALGKEVLAYLPLPFGGLMSCDNAFSVIEQLNHLNAVVSSLGCTLPAPFMSLSFVSLPTVPELGLTDMGLVNVKKNKIISPFFEV